MVLISYSGREINAKLVYYGPGLSGKTTNLEFIYGAIPQTNRGKMVSMKTKTERTLFFDFLPIDLGELSGFKTRFLLYTVPGQVYYNATRKLVLKGVDAIVFVADSKRGKMDENIESLQNLRENLREHGIDLDKMPWVIQYNKRDLPDVYSIDELERTLNPGKVPSFEAVGTTGVGVFETFKAMSRMLLKHLAREIGVRVVASPSATSSASATPPAPIALTPPPPQVPPVVQPIALTPPPTQVPPVVHPIAQTLPPSQATPFVQPIALAPPPSPVEPETQPIVLAPPAQQPIALSPTPEPPAATVPPRLGLWSPVTSVPPLSKSAEAEDVSRPVSPLRLMPVAPPPPLERVEPAPSATADTALVPKGEEPPAEEEVELVVENSEHSFDHPSNGTSGPGVADAASEEADRRSGVGGRLRRWFGRARETDESGFTVEMDVNRETVTRPTTPETTLRPGSTSAFPSVQASTPAESAPAEPRFREVPILVDLEPEDLERGVVLKLRICVRRSSETHAEEPEKGRLAA